MSETENTKSPFDKEPAEGSRETVDHQLAEQERRAKQGNHEPGVEVSGQPQGGAVDRAHATDKK